MIDKIIDYVSSTPGLIAVRSEGGPTLTIYRNFQPYYYLDISEYPEEFGTTVSMPEEKLDYLFLPRPVEYWLVNSKQQHAVIIPDYVLDSSSTDKSRRVYISIRDCNIIHLSEVVNAANSWNEYP